MIIYGFSFVFPFLLVLSFLQTGAVRLRFDLTKLLVFLFLVFLAVFLVWLPVAGLPLARWLISLNANFSILLTGLLVFRIWERFTGKRLDNSRFYRHFYIFAFLAGLFLYPMALGLGPFDLYQFGWGLTWLHGAIMLISIGLIWAGQPLGVLLVLSYLAFELRLLESTNLWDYLIDPFLFFYAIGALIRQYSIKKVKGKNKKRKNFL